jgi:hypothetical protein
MTKDRMTRLEGLYAYAKSPDALAHIGDPTERADADAFVQTVFNAIAVHMNALHEYVATARRAGRQPDPLRVKAALDTFDSYLSDIEKVMFMPATPPRAPSDPAAIEQPQPALDHEAPAIEQLSQLLSWGAQHWPEQGGPAGRDQILDLGTQLLDSYSPPPDWRPETKSERDDRRDHEEAARRILAAAATLLEPLGIHLNPKRNHWCR